MYNPHDTHSLISSIITDMRLIQEFCKSSLKTYQTISQVNNLTSFINLLKYKNSQYSYSDEHRQQNQVWSINKSSDIQPLIKKAKQIKQQYDQKQQIKTKQQHNYFYVSPTDLEKQNQFISKCLQYSCFGVIQHTQYQSKYRQYLLGKVLGRRKDKIVQTIRKNQNNFSGTSMSIMNFKQNKIKIQIYLKAINHLFQNSAKLADKQWTTAFKTKTKLKIWEILDNLLPQRDQIMNSNTYPLYKVAMQSLKIVESQLNSALPSNYQSILYNITTHYLRKMQGHYINEGSIGPIWAIAYVLYKAGRKQEFYRYLPDQQLRQMFQEVDSSIENLTPMKVQGVEQNGDAFHDQLVFCLAGQSKYSSNMLCNPDSLDIAWIFLRNVGIFPESTNKFIQLRSQMYNSYQNVPLSEIKIKNLVYLLCFEQLVQIGPNQMMDNHDYLHFLIMIYHSSFFRSIYINTNNILEKKLTERLVQFIEKLLIEKRKQSIYYISFIPYSSLANQVSLIITKLKLLQQIKWKQLSKQLPEKIYRNLIQLTCQKYVDLLNQYCIAAEKIKLLLGDQEKAINYIAQMNIKSILEFRRDQQMLVKGQNIVKSIFKTSQTLSIQYGSLFQFFKQYEKLTQLILQRNEQKIYKFIKTCKHILISSQVRVDTSDMLDKLIERNGFDCYLYYIKDVIRAYDIALTKMGRIHDLHELQRLTLSAIVQLLDLQPYQQFIKNQAATALIKMLENSLYKPV